MSAEADVAFMEDACGRIADARAPGQRLKVKVGAVLKALRVPGRWEPTENRVYEFLKRKARRVDGFEKDRARAVVQAIEAENARREAEQFEQRLRDTLTHLKASDPDFFGPEIDALEHAIVEHSRTDSALAVPGETNDRRRRGR